MDSTSGHVGEQALTARLLARAAVLRFADAGVLNKRDAKTGRWSVYLVDGEVGRFEGKGPTLPVALRDCLASANARKPATPA